MKNYSRKWITQRVTAALLLPLTFWFIYSAISLSSVLVKLALALIDIKSLESTPIDSRYCECIISAVENEKIQANIINIIFLKINFKLRFNFLLIIMKEQILNKAIVVKYSYPQRNLNKKVV